MEVLREEFSLSSLKSRFSSGKSVRSFLEIFKKIFKNTFLQNISGRLLLFSYSTVFVSEANFLPTGYTLNLWVLLLEKHLLIISDVSLGKKASGCAGNANSEE